MIIHTVSHWILHFYEYLEFIRTKPVNFPPQIFREIVHFDDVNKTRDKNFVPILCPVLTNI